MIRVFVSGCYDIIHGGHIEFFNQAKALGDYLIVSVANDEVLREHKHRKPSMPLAHKVAVLKSLVMVDEVIVGDSRATNGLDFIEHFRRIKPEILAVTEDDRYEAEKRLLCGETNTHYMKLPKTLGFEKRSSSEIIQQLKAPDSVPLRVDFGGGWLDVPKLAKDGAYIVNCAIVPKVNLEHWAYAKGGGLGGSAAFAILRGDNAFDKELELGVGWQDPAVIQETGLCVWKSGAAPILEMKVNPDFLEGLLGLYWTGAPHCTPDNIFRNRNYTLIEHAGKVAREGVLAKSVSILSEAVRLSYRAQLAEGMCPLPDFGAMAMKYSGGGWGGYALHCFESREARSKVDVIPVEPYLECNRT